MPCPCCILWFRKKKQTLCIFFSNTRTVFFQKKCSRIHKAFLYIKDNLHVEDPLLILVEGQSYI